MTSTSLLQQMLEEENQKHLLEPEIFAEILPQLLALEKTLPDGGLRRYIHTSRSLIAAAAKGENALPATEISPAQGLVIEPDSSLFQEVERLGTENWQANKVACVVVAGGLGERLNYQGIKLEIPVEMSSEKCFLQHYCECIQSLQGKEQIPLAIMTSDDTHQATQELLEENNYFGMAENQIILIKQNKVPCFSDINGKISLTHNSDSQRHHISTHPHHPQEQEKDHHSKKVVEIETKPHGHGDVHILLHLSGLAEKWQSEGREWVVFFQDTNPNSFFALPAAIGAAEKMKFSMNSVTIPRKPKEAIGGIATVHLQDDRRMVLNVEYNQIPPLTKEKDDIADETGFSPFPGNINLLVFHLKQYCAQLKASGGAVPEFVNPKFNDTKTELKSSTRLECMMQSFAQLLQERGEVDDEGWRVGFTQFPRWLCFTTVKNKLEEGRVKMAAGIPPETAASAESEFYAAHRALLKMNGVCIDDSSAPHVILGQPLQIFPTIYLAPSFSLPLFDLERKLVGRENIRISSRSSLFVEGKNVLIEHLDLDGALVINTSHIKHATVIIRHLSVKNKGWNCSRVEDLPQRSDFPPHVLIRGFEFEKTETARVEVQVGDGGDVEGRLIVVDDRSEGEEGVRIVSV